MFAFSWTYQIFKTKQTKAKNNLFWRYLNICVTKDQVTNSKVHLSYFSLNAFITSAPTRKIPFFPPSDLLKQRGTGVLRTHVLLPDSSGLQVSSAIHSVILNELLIFAMLQLPHL